MATRSTLAMVHKDGTVDSIYCHNDGYLSNNGFLLYTEYQDSEKVKQMVSLGGMSSLEANLFPVGNTHHFDNKEANVCVFYHRDRGEEFFASHYESLQEFVESGNHESYVYIYQEKKQTWYILNVNAEIKPLYGALIRNLKYENMTHKVLKVKSAKATIKLNREKLRLAKSLNKSLPVGQMPKQPKI